MSLTAAKIDAQRVLLGTRKKAVAVSFLTLFFKLLFIIAFSVSVYALTLLPAYEKSAENLYLKIAFYALFSLGIVLSVLFYALTDFFGKHWFYKNASTEPPVSAFFVRLRAKHAVKICFLFWLRRLLGGLLLLGYLAPFLAGLFALAYVLRTTGLAEINLYITLAALALCLPLCLYFGFSALQRFSFCDGLLTEDPNRGVVETLRESKALAQNFGFPLAHIKLRFLLWGVSCFLFFPLFYVLPYYQQSVGCAVETVIDKNHLSAVPQKPIVFLLSAKAHA